MPFQILPSLDLPRSASPRASFVHACSTLPRIPYLATQNVTWRRERLKGWSGFEFWPGEVEKHYNQGCLRIATLDEEE